MTAAGALVGGASVLRSCVFDYRGDGGTDALAATVPYVPTFAGLVVASVAAVDWIILLWGVVADVPVAAAPPAGICTPAPIYVGIFASSLAELYPTLYGPGTHDN